MELSSILDLPLDLMTGAQFLTLMAEALKYRRQPETQAATVNRQRFSDGQKYAYAFPAASAIIILRTVLIIQNWN